MEHICDVRQEKQHSTETKTSDGELQLSDLHEEAHPMFHNQQNVVSVLWPYLHKRGIIFTCVKPLHFGRERKGTRLILVSR